MGTIAVGGVFSFADRKSVGVSARLQKLQHEWDSCHKKWLKVSVLHQQEVSRAEDFRVWQCGTMAAMKLSVTHEVVSPKYCE